MWVSSLAILTACTPLATRTIDLHANAEQLDARRLDSDAVDAALVRAGMTPPATATRWTLDALTVAAWQLRPELAEARSIHAAARADQVAAAQSNAIGLSIVPEFVRQAAEHPWTLIASVAWAVPNPARQAARKDSAIAASESAAWQQAQTAWQIASEVRRGWVALADLDQSIALAERNVALHDERVRLLQRRVALGAEARSSVDAATLPQIQARTDRESLIGRRAEALGTLAHACGLPPDGLDTIALQLDAKAPPAPEWSSLQEAAAFNNLELAAALSKYAEVEAAEREQQAAGLPALTLGPGFGFDRGEHKWTLGADLSVENPTRRLAVQDAAESRREAAADHVLVVQADTLARLDSIRTQWARLQSETRHSDEAVAAAENASRAAQTRWQSGQLPRNAVIGAQLEQVAIAQARQQLATEQHDLVGALEAAVQRPVWPLSRLAMTTSIGMQREDAHALSLD